MKNQTVKTEIWKDVVGYETAFEVSNLGRIRKKTGNKAIRKPCKSPRGYVNIILTHNGKSTSTTVHRVMAEAFIPNPNPEKLTQVNHINGIKDDNRLENFEWTAPKTNMEHARDNGLNNTGKKLSHDKADQIRVLRKQGMTLHAIASIYNVSDLTISNVVNNKVWVR